MAELELKLNREEVNAIVRQWVEKHYPTLKVGTITTTFGRDSGGYLEFDSDSSPVFENFKIKLEQREVK